MTDQEQIAAFLASRGATRVETGASALNLTDRDWHKAARNPQRIENAAIRERHVIVDHLGRTRVRNGLGEWIA